MIERSTGAADRALTWRRIQAASSLTLIALIGLADLAAPHWLHLTPVLGAAPVLAAATAGVWATAGIATLTMLLTVLLDVAQHLHFWGHASSGVNLIAVAAVCLASLLACSIRQRRERALTQVRSVAEAAQRALLRPLPRHIGAFALRGTYLAAEAEARLGGDLYEVLHTPYGIRLLIGDVRGKGLPAVGASAALLGSFREAAYQEPKLTEVAVRLEESTKRQIELVYAEPFTERFATALLVEIPATGQVARMVHCGHPEPLTIHGRQVTAHPPEKPGAPIGLADLIGAEYVTESIPFHDGDRMVFYTDGFIEARNRQGAFYNLPAGVRERADEPLDDLVRGLHEDLLRHVGGDLGDDAALLIIERSCP